jgi:acyl-coenzyme A synthetase/AMP-(fatty) acid ligase
LDVFWILTSTQWELRSRMLDHLSLYKVPRRIWFPDALPRTRTGKVQRGVLTHRWGKEPV